MSVSEPMSENLKEVAQIAEKIVETQGKIAKYLNDRKQYSIICLVFSVVDVIIILYGKVFLNQGLLIGSVVGISLIALLIGIAALGVQGNILTLRGDVDVLNMRLRILNILSGNVENLPSYFDRLVQINVENLASYYSIVKGHTDKSFFASIVAGAIGFLLVIVGLAIGFVNLDHTPTITYIATASGVITEFIAGVFFYLYNRTVRQMKGYHVVVVHSLTHMIMIGVKSYLVL